MLYFVGSSDKLTRTRTILGYSLNLLKERVITSIRSAVDGGQTLANKTPRCFLPKRKPRVASGSSVFSCRFNLTVDKNKLGKKKHETFMKQLRKSNLLTSVCWTLPFLNLLSLQK